MPSCWAKCSGLQVCVNELSREEFPDPWRAAKCEKCVQMLVFPLRRCPPDEVRSHPIALMSTFTPTLP